MSEMLETASILRVTDDFFLTVGPNFAVEWKKKPNKPKTVNSAMNESEAQYEKCRNASE